MLAATLCSDAKGTRCQAQLVERVSEYGTTRSRPEHVPAEHEICQANFAATSNQVVQTEWPSAMSCKPQFALVRHSDSTIFFSKIRGR